MKFLPLFIVVLLLGFVGLGHGAQQVPAPRNVAMAPAKSVKVAQGLFYQVLKKGKSNIAKKQYIKNLTTAWTSADGKTQFSAQEDGIDVSDPDSLAAMVPGLAQALRLTPIGEKRRWWVSAALMLPGWGDMVAGNYTLDIEVLDELDPLPAPANVAKAPADAVTTPTGLQYKVLVKAKGDDKVSKRPRPSDTVRVHYSGWTRDGKMFDSSLLRDRPIEFPLNRVIKGWGEGVSFMSVGDKYRFWIPQAIAYGDNPRAGAPKGDLVFDIELFKVIGVGK